MTIDAGNTRQRFALFENNLLLETGELSELNNQERFKNLLQIESMAATVKPFAWPESSTHWKVLPFPKRADGENFLEMPVRYSSTLGQDRLCSCYLAYRLRHFHTSGPSLIIDAGTYTTIDVVDDSGHLGGYILPGDDLLANSYQRAELLHRPQLHSNLALNIFDQPLPDTTEKAMQHGIHAMLASFYHALIIKFNPSIIYITGGLGPHHWKLIQRNFLSRSNSLVIQQPHLIHFGLLLMANQIKNISLSDLQLQQIAQQVGITFKDQNRSLQLATSLNNEIRT